MPRKNQIVKNKRHESAFTPASDDAVARVAISEAGKIVYASEAFCALSHISLETEPVEASTVIDLTKSDKSLDSLPAGTHKVRLNGHKKSFDFHFDWLTAPDKQRYLVGSQMQQKKKQFSKADKKALRDTILPHLKQNDNRQDKQTVLQPEDLQQFFTVSGDIMLVLDESGNIIRTNQKFHDIFTPETSFSDLFKNGQKHAAPHFETQVKTSSGEFYWIEWHQKRKNNLIYCTGRDITSIKRQKRDLNKREEQLSQAESIGGLGHWHWTIGADEIEWSEEIFRIFGVNKEEFKPSLQSMTGKIHRQDIDRVNHVFQRAFIGQNNYETDFRIVRPGGEERFIRCEGRCAFDEEGDVIALYGIMQDMTERMLYERELKAAKDAAERAYAAKSQFLANMSHELRTPLNAIIGFSEMMQRQLLGPIGTEKYLEYIENIRDSGGHLLDLISDILDMSKIEAGKYELTLEETGVTSIIGKAVNMIEGRALDAGIKISTGENLNEDLVIVADRRAFLQIILNLLSNAVKFTEEGGKISIECHERENYVSLKVIDNGIGIPANKLAQITRPFEQASSSYARDHEGSGLGLAITKELIEMHGGNMFIESSVGVGTTVTVRLPYNADKTVQQKKEKQPA